MGSGHHHGHGGCGGGCGGTCSSCSASAGKRPTMGAPSSLMTPLQKLWARSGGAFDPQALLDANGLTCLQWAGLPYAQKVAAVQAVVHNPGKDILSAWIARTDNACTAPGASPGFRGTLASPGAMRRVSAPARVLYSQGRTGAWGQPTMGWRGGMRPMGANPIDGSTDTGSTDTSGDLTNPDTNPKAGLLTEGTGYTGTGGTGSTSTGTGSSTSQTLTGLTGLTTGIGNAIAQGIAAGKTPAPTGTQPAPGTTGTTQQGANTQGLATAQPSFFQKNKTWLIGGGIAVTGVGLAWYFTRPRRGRR